MDEVGFMIIFFGAGSLIIGVSILYFVFNSYWKSHGFWKKIGVSIPLGFLSLCIAFALHPLALLLAIYIVGAVVLFVGLKSWDRGEIRQKVFGAATVALMVAQIFVSFLINFQYLGTRARQSEAKTNLSAIATAEIAYFADYNVFGNTFYVICWEPQGTTKYSYFLSDKKIPDAVFMSDIGVDLKRFSWDRREQVLFFRHKNSADRDDGGNRDRVGKKIKEISVAYGIGVTADSFTAVAIGDIDNDSFFDVWLINQNKTLKNVENDLGENSNNRLTLNLLVAEIGDEYVAIYATRLSALLVLINLVLWKLFSAVNRKGKSNEDVESSDGVAGI